VFSPQGLSCITAPVISACSYCEFPWAATWSGRLSPSPVCTVNCVPTQHWCPNILSVISKCTPCYHYYRKSISWPAMHTQLISLHPTLVFFLLVFWSAIWLVFSLLLLFVFPANTHHLGSVTVSVASLLLIVAQ
jgi:hypothetical protein